MKGGILAATVAAVCVLSASLTEGVPSARSTKNGDESAVVPELDKEQEELIGMRSGLCLMPGGRNANGMCSIALQVKECVSRDEKFNMGSSLVLL